MFSPTGEIVVKSHSPNTSGDGAVCANGTAASSMVNAIVIPHRFIVCTLLIG
ncbi:MAG: hypothetical protein QM736_09690 [Vicinamibacterales bacterium]